MLKTIYALSANYSLITKALKYLLSLDPHRSFSLPKILSGHLFLDGRDGAHHKGADRRAAGHEGGAQRVQGEGRQTKP